MTVEAINIFDEDQRHLCCSWRSSGLCKSLEHELSGDV